MSSRFVDIHTHSAPQNGVTITSYGIHPWYAEQAATPLCDEDFEAHDAVGEIGLDMCCKTPINIQQRLFYEQLEIAQRLRKIVVIHCVRGYNEVVATLKGFDLRCVIFHGFIGSKQLSSELVACGYFLSFGHRSLSSPKSMEALRAIPLNRLFFESDESDIEVCEIYDRAAKILGVEVSILKDIIYSNYKTILE